MTKAAAAPPTEAPVEMPAEDPGDVNLRFWKVLGKSDPRQTKPITGRGFDGTALKPMWQNMRMTEVFGPVGQGWGTLQPDFQFVTHGTSTLVYCTVALWYKDPATGEQVQYVYGVGGDVAGGTRNNGKVFIDDEAPKKAYTDALGNAFKFVGVAADIHMGMFDDSKYVQDLTKEFIANEDELGKKVDALQEQIRTCDDVKALVTDLLPVAKDLGEQLIEAKRDGEQKMLASVFNARKAKLSQPSQVSQSGDAAAVAARDQANADTNT